MATKSDKPLFAFHRTNRLDQWLPLGQVFSGPKAKKAKRSRWNLPPIFDPSELNFAVPFSKRKAKIIVAQMLTLKMSEMCWSTDRSLGRGSEILKFKCQVTCFEPNEDDRAIDLTVRVSGYPAWTTIKR